MTESVDVHRIEIDVRFLLANERTLLSWLRTSLALQAGGLALIHFAAEDAPLVVVGVALLVLGVGGGLAGYRRYRAAGRAIHTGQLPRAGWGPMLMTVGTTAIAAVVLIIFAVERLW